MEDDQGYSELKFARLGLYSSNGNAINDFRRRFDACIESLAKTEEWDRKMHALSQMQKLVESHTSESYASVSDLFTTLVPRLVEQMQDRRSMVSKQACQTVATLVEVYKTKMESSTLQLLPACFRAQGMGIAPVSDAADEAARAIITHCPSGRLIPFLWSTIMNDKNTKQREAASKYILQALEEWEGSTYEFQEEQIQHTIILAAQDASGVVRSTGRESFIAYARSSPEGAAAALERIPDTERPLKAKLLALAKECGIDLVRVSPKTGRRLSLGGRASPNGGAFRMARSSREGPLYSSLDSSATPRMPRPMLASAMATPRVPIREPVVNSPSSPLAETMTYNDPPMTQFARSRKSLGGALRVAAPVARMEEDITGPIEYLPTSNLCKSTIKKAPVRIPIACHNNTDDAVYKAPSRATETVASENSLRNSPQIPALLDSLSKRGVEWSEKVALYQALDESIRRSSNSNEENTNGEKLVKVLLEGAGDAHFKVSTAALRAIQTASSCAPGLLESSLERVVPLLFQRSANPKEQIRSYAFDTLSNIASNQQPEPVLSSLVRALDVNRAPKVKVSILEYSQQLLEDRYPPRTGRSNEQHGHKSALRPMVSRFMSLVRDKNPDIRRAAVNAITTAYRSDSCTVAWAVSELPPSPQAALRKVLSAAYNTVEADIEVIQATAQKLHPSQEALNAASPLVSKLAASQALARALEEDVESPRIKAGASTDCISSMLTFDDCETTKEQLKIDIAVDCTGSGPVAAEDEIELSFAAIDSEDDDADKEKEEIESQEEPVAVQEEVKQPLDVTIKVLLDDITTVTSESTLQQLAWVLRSVPKKEELEPVASTIMDRIVPMLGSESLIAREFAQEVMEIIIPVTEIPLLVQHAPQILVHLLPHSHIDCDVDMNGLIAPARVMRALLERIDLAIGFTLLIEHLPEADCLPPFEGKAAEIVISALFQLYILLERIVSKQLSVVMDAVFPSLHSCYGSSHADLRKLAMKNMVKCWQVLGDDEMQPHLTRLSPAQLKLLKIHYSRAQRQTTLTATE